MKPVNAKYRKCPWSTAQVREIVTRKVDAMGGRRAFDWVGAEIREAVAMATIMEAFVAYAHGARTHGAPEGSIVFDADIVDDTKAAFFNEFGIEPAQSFVYDERVG